MLTMIPTRIEESVVLAFEPNSSLLFSPLETVPGKLDLVYFQKILE